MSALSLLPLPVVVGLHNITQPFVCFHLLGSEFFFKALRNELAELVKTTVLKIKKLRVTLWTRGGAHTCTKWKVRQQSSIKAVQERDTKANIYSVNIIIHMYRQAIIVAFFRHNLIIFSFFFKQPQSDDRIHHPELSIFFKYAVHAMKREWKQIHNGNSQV